MGGAESEEWELKQEQIEKKKNEKNDTDKRHLSYPWLFYYWNSKEDFEWEAVSSMQENVLFSPVLQSHWIFYSITFSSEFITRFGTIFFYSLVCDIFKLHVFTFCFTPTLLWAGQMFILWNL